MTAVDAARPTPADLRALVADADARLQRAVASLTEPQAAAGSALPGWTRAHVLAHLASLSDALARQIEFALRGELVDLYDGGRPARDAAIEAGARDPLDVQRAALGAGIQRLTGLLGGLSLADGERPVRLLNGVVHDVGLAWWREVEIHLADLDLGPSSAAWGSRLCDHLAAFLAQRIPAGTAVTLRGDQWVRELGTGTPRVVRGERTDLVAWLAGRRPARPVLADDGAPLPALGPWPQTSSPQTSSPQTSSPPPAPSQPARPPHVAPPAPPSSRPTPASSD